MDFSWLLETPIAHRGLYNNALPENSIGAFQNAVDNRVSVEMDIHLSRDNQLVVFHDDSLLRMCGVNKKIKDCTVAELKTYRLKGTNYTIPTFDEFLAIISGKVGILCEIKGINPWELSIAKAVVERVKTYKGNIALQSFNFGAVSYFRKNSDRPYGQLCSWHSVGEKGRSFVSGYFGKLCVLKKSKPQFVTYDIRALDKRYSENKYIIKALGKIPLIMWTINSDEKLSNAIGHCNNMIFEHMSLDTIIKAHNTLPLYK